MAHSQPREPRTPAWFSPPGAQTAPLGSYDPATMQNTLSSGSPKVDVVGQTSGSGPRAQSSVLNPSDTFAHRHIGPSEAEIAEMLQVLGYGSLESFTDAVVPASIRLKRPMELSGLAVDPKGEHELL